MCNVPPVCEWWWSDGLHMSWQVLIMAVTRVLPRPAPVLTPEVKLACPANMTHGGPAAGSGAGACSGGHPCPGTGCPQDQRCLHDVWASCIPRAPGCPLPPSREVRNGALGLCIDRTVALTPGGVLPAALHVPLDDLAAVSQAGMVAIRLPKEHPYHTSARICRPSLICCADATKRRPLCSRGKP